MVTLEDPTVKILKNCVEAIIKRKDKNMAFALCKQLKEVLDEQTKQEGEECLTSLTIQAQRTLSG